MNELDLTHILYDHDQVGFARLEANRLHQACHPHCLAGEVIAEVGDAEPLELLLGFPREADEEAALLLPCPSGIQLQEPGGRAGGPHRELDCSLLAHAAGRLGGREGPVRADISFRIRGARGFRFGGYGLVRVFAGDRSGDE